MSIENNLKRIADALEKIAANGSISGAVEVVAEAAKTVPPKPPLNGPINPPPKPPAAGPTPPAPVTAPVATPPAAPAVTPPPAPAVQMTVKELDEVLKAEYVRLGQNEAAIAMVKGAMAPYGVNVQSVDTAKYGELIAAVKAL